VATVAGLLAVTALAVSNARTWQAQKLAEERAEQIRQNLEHFRYADALLDRGRWYAKERRWDDAHAASPLVTEFLYHCSPCGRHTSRRHDGILNRRSVFPLQRGTG